MKFSLKILIVFVLILGGCIEDIVQPDPNIQIESSAKLLWYLESKGDYINSNAPSLINADELFINRADYLIIDVRKKDEFLSGHIEASINIENDSLLSFIEFQNAESFPKVVLISSSGQAASYYTCLLRLLGYENVFALHFGMAAWHRQFADPWISNSKNDENIFHLFKDTAYSKPDFSYLPKVIYKDGETIEQKLKSRVDQLIKEGFSEDKFFSSSTSSISFEFALFNGDPFIICYGPSPLYYFPNGILHPIGSVFYSGDYPFLDLRSIAYLQTIPPNRTIAIYSISGHLSAFATAYLRVLGYDVKSILFGANTIMYSVLDLHEILGQDLFRESQIGNYPFIF